jgi:hypothetical protein
MQRDGDDLETSHQLVFLDLRSPRRAIVPHRNALTGRGRHGRGRDSVSHEGTAQLRAGPGVRRRPRRGPLKATSVRNGAVAGATGTLSLLAKAVRRFSKSTDAAFPAWQGMQYFVSMFIGQAQLHHVDNDRYGDHTWITVRDVVTAHRVSGPEVAQGDQIPTPILCEPSKSACRNL